MKVCFPVEAAEGLNSMVYGHFGSAPAFLMVDTETNQAESVAGASEHGFGGQCQPLSKFGGREVDALVVAGIGGGALMRLGAAGIKVFRAVEGTVQDNLDLLARGVLPHFEPGQVCQGHARDHGGGCAH